MALSVVAAAAAIVATRAVPFVSDPARVPSNPDTAFYQWRSELLTAHSPETLVSFSGPQGEGGSGYRVATPLLGALLRSASGTQTYTVPKLLVIGFNSLLVLAIAGTAYRYRRDALLLAAVAVWAGWSLLWPPFTGFLDNVLALLLLVTALAFVDDGRRGAAAVAVLVFVAFLAHPPAVIGFVVAVVLASALRMLLERRWRTVPADERAVLAAALGGIAAGYAAWRIGAWGAASSLGDAIHPNRISQEAFAAVLSEWLAMFEPWFAAPLIAVGILGLFLLGRPRFTNRLLPRTGPVRLLNTVQGAARS